MERYIGCMLCGVGKDVAKFERCEAEARAAGIEMAPGFNEHTHIWTEMVSAPAGIFGKGLIDELNIIC